MGACPTVEMAALALKAVESVVPSPLVDGATSIAPESAALS